MDSSAAANALDLVDPRLDIDTQAVVMDRACSTTGFFRVPLDVVTPQVAAAAWDGAGEFFALPEAAKRAVGFPEPGYPYGYSPLQFESLARSLDDVHARPDLKESLSAGPDCGVDAALAPAADAEWIRSPSQWPVELPHLRAAWQAYYRQLAVVSEQLMEIMAVALGLDRGYFRPLIDQPISSMRALHYPALSHDDDAVAQGSLRAGAHSDYGTLTILRTDDVPGLEILRADDTWQAVQPDPNTFVVNLGDSIAQWTNDRWRSTVHRVVATDVSVPRRSFAFFHMANWDTEISCLPTCLEAGQQPRHAPVQAGPWLMAKFQSTVT